MLCVPDAPEGDARTVPGRGAKAPVALSDMASDDASREPRPEPGSEASTAAQGEGDSRSVSDATNLLTRRLRVAETTVEALEAALARKEELLGEASERERTLIFDILRRVISDAELAVRRKLSAQLAEFDDAPSDLVVALAKDEIEVAYPILTRSRALEDEQLIEVCKRGRKSTSSPPRPLR